MAQMQIIDTDLITANVKDSVEVLGITGTWVNDILVDGEYIMGPAAVSHQNGGSGNQGRGAVRFYDEGTKIIVMGESSVSHSFSHGVMAYYGEINKSTMVYTRYPSAGGDMGSTGQFGNTKMCIVNIGGTNRYCWTRATNDTSTSYWYFDGTTVTQAKGGDKTNIISASNVGQTSIILNGKTLQGGDLYHSEDNVTFGMGGSCFYTFKYI